MKKAYIIPELLIITELGDIITQSIATEDLAEDYSISWGDKIFY